MARLSNFKTAQKGFEIRFDAPVLSSDGGLLVLKKLDARLGLTARMATRISDARKGDPTHTVLKMLRQRVYGICQGWEDCNDFERLSSDPLYKQTLEAELASQPTLSRLENAVTYKDLLRLSLELVHQFVDSHKSSPPAQIVIDMDATEDPAHGQQEFEFYHGYYGRHCFLPLLVFCSVDGGEEELVGAILRPGNIHAGRRSASILKRLVLILKEAFPEVQIMFRGDAGFALPEVYDCCEGLGISYLISLARNSKLEALAGPFLQDARAKRRESKQIARVFGEIRHAAKTWTHERRVIIKAEAMEKGDNPRFVVTNLEGDPQALYERYCKRGESENRIKELKLDLLSGRTSCHKFTANCFRLLLHALSFVLLSALRRMLEGTALARATMGQIRLKILKVGVLIETSTRRVLARLPRGHPHADLLRELIA
jgi:hypothetical protein